MQAPPPTHAFLGYNKDLLSLQAQWVALLGLPQP